MHKNTKGRTPLLTILLVASLIFSAFAGLQFISIAGAALQDWNLTVDGRSVKGSPDLREYVWQKNASAQGSNPFTNMTVSNGPYDKIGLHRLVKINTVRKGAVFMVPTVYGSGEQLMSNPSESNYSVDESSSQVLYWANRGFDVYSYDSRAHFLPLTMNNSQAAAVAINWGWDIWISDMKEAVDKAKEISGYSKIFLAGMGWGGTPQLFYASKYWKEDLNGIILLDGGENTAKYTATNTQNVTALLQTAVTTNAVVYENPRRPGGTAPNVPSGMIFCYQNAVQNPGAPAQWPSGTLLNVTGRNDTINPLTNRACANITEWIAYDQFITNYSNIYAGYGNITVIIQRMGNENRYYPYRLTIESNAVHNWNSCPFVSFDFDDHFKEINVPVLGFRDERLALPTYGNFTNGLATTDLIQINLPNYGHNDVYTGTNSPKDVSEKAYQWMLGHLSKLDITARQSAAVLPGWTWWFYEQNMGGNAPYTYQWYEGLSSIQSISTLQGQTSAVLSVTKSTPGTYTFYCRVTDKDGTTTTSNAVTLTVLG